MTDYGHEVRLGIFPTPDAADPQRAVELAVLADTTGIDVVSVQDHPYNARQVDSWTLLTWMAARTTHVSLAQNVASLPLRPPVVLARSVATLDLLSGGRAHLGLGTGAFWDAIAAAGGPRRSPGEAVDALVEAVEVVRGVWRGEGSVRVDGEHYRVRGLHSGPAPHGDPGIWLGAYGPRMQRVTGRLADGWLPSMAYLPPEKLGEANARIDAAAVRTGRSPQDVVRLYNVHGRFGATGGRGGLHGTPADWAEQLAALVLEHGMSVFILATDDPRDVRTFGDEVGPALRELVAAERSGSARPSAQHTAGTGAGTSDPGAGTAYAPESGGAAGGAAQHLVDIHDHLRRELAQLRDVVDQVRQGQLGAGQARSVLNTMAMRQNNWTLGAFCASYCRLVTGHHTLEDRAVFPHLRRAEPEVAPVLDRLQEEHEVIAALLDGVDRALVAVVEEDTYGQAGRVALDELGHRVDELGDALLPHLAYEERELAGPLTRHGFG